MSDYRPAASQVAVARLGEAAPSTAIDDAKKAYEDQKKVRGWLAHFFTDPAQVFEVRYFTKKKCGEPGGPIYGGWFKGNDLDRAAKAIVDAARKDEWRHVSGVFIVPNPIDPGKAGVTSFGQIKRRYKTTGDDAILERRWVLLDIDADRPRGDDSATDSEKAAAGALAARVREHLTACGWPEPIVVDSGNGFQLSYRVEPSVRNLGDFLHRMKARFAHPGAHIDPAVGNLSRLFKAPGGISRKGPGTDERPHRRSKIVSAPAVVGALTAERFAATLAELPAVEGKPAASPGTPAVAVPTYRVPATDLTDRAIKYLAKLPESIDGARGHDALLWAARAVAYGFDMEPEAAFDLLMTHFNPRCRGPWSEQEVRHKIEEANRVPFDKRRGYLRDAPPPGNDAVPDAEISPELLARITGGKSVNSGDGPPALVTPPTDDDLNEADDDPHKLARAVLAGFLAGGRRTLAYWQGEFHAWDGCRYKTEKEVKFRPRVNRIVRRELVAIYKLRVKAWEASGRDGEPPKVAKLTTGSVSNILEALQGMLLLGFDESPAWIEGATGPAPQELVPTASGLVYLPDYSSGKPGGLLEHTPHYFNFHTTGYRVDPNAPPPAAWLAFLESLWPDDPDSIALLQEWFGYLLTPDNQYHKLLWMVGPTRSGKGTICNVIRNLVGDSTCAAPALWKFGKSQFAQSSLVGKSVALIEDCKLSKNVDTSVMVETILTITGDGNTEVEGKGKDAYGTRLTSRFVIASNDPPTLLLDEAGAMLARTCLLETEESFLGREDRTLLPRLLAELPSIFNWAVEGWKRLRDRKQFTIPEGAAHTAQKLADEQNPVRRFVRERCDVGLELHVPKAEAYTAYSEWCPRVKLSVKSFNQFGRSLRAAVPALKGTQLRNCNHDRIDHYRGIALRPNLAFDDDERLPFERPEADTPTAPEQSSSHPYETGQL